ncbi:DegT/DnrJ/EryC1/StrS aminotransferase family protein [Candidatus Woesearchaeota archaeon]|nr:DegT/DnrJ/EryC1/StrS aminotransferase family protein [Candidatus Woesearchaeota archaeon]MBT7558862.1 DegT/DnrJ/EryC1/StrS aminotransferase family protein [Candidatus Woesearchaeota archaeon]
MISLVKDTIDEKDIDRLVDWLKTYPRLTKGTVTLEFEEKFSNWLGRKHSVFVNSGSSANLLVLSALLQGKYLKNTKIVVPSTAWSTDLAPVIQLGLKPLLCDSNLNDLSVDLEHLEKIFVDESPSALLLVSVLGLVPDMENVVELCDKYDVILLEDTCEAMGCEYIGQKLGTFGLASTFSTFFGHHISTIEGGIISTDDKDFYELLVSIRSHGWDRDLSKETQVKLQKEWGVSEFNALYTFYYSGFNFRSTDLQAYIGLTQIDKLDDWGKRREDNYYLYQRLINTEWKPTSYFDSLTSNFAYPVISSHRDKIVKKLQENKVEVRPMICGSMGTQPFYVKHYGRLELPNVSLIDRDGFYVPNHPKLTVEEITFITEIINGEISE